MRLGDKVGEDGRMGSAPAGLVVSLALSLVLESRCLVALQILVS